MITTKTILQSLVAVLAIGLAAPALAAPTNSASSDEDLSGPQREPAARSAVDAASAVEGANGSRTIQLLIELQDSKSLVDLGERSITRTDRAERLEAAKRGAAPAAATALPGPAPNPFSSDAEQVRPSATRNEQPSAGAVEWNNTDPRRAEAGFDSGRSRGETPGSGASPQSGEPSKLWLPVALIRYVRDNRATVLIGSLVVLALVWLSAAKASQRRH